MNYKNILTIKLNSYVAYIRMYLVIALSKTPVNHGVWCKPHSHVYWEAVKAGAFGDEWWHDNVWMSKATFGVLCDQLRPHIGKAATKYHLPFAVDMQVAVTIWRLATNIEYRTILLLNCLDWEFQQCVR